MSTDVLHAATAAARGRALGQHRLLLAALLPVTAVLSLLDAAPAVAAPQGLLAQIQLEDAGGGTATGLWLSRVANYVTLTGVIGFLLAAAVLVGPGRWQRANVAAARVAAVLAGWWALSAVALFIFGASNAAARPLPEALGGVILGQFATTRFGSAVLAQAVVAAAVMIVAAAVRRPGTAWAALAGAALGAFAPAWWGHAGTAQPRILALANDWVHVLGVTVWVGGLAALCWLALRRSDVTIVEPFGRFSRLAGWALAAVLVTGLVNTFFGMSELSQFISTTWGRLALTKLVILGVLAWLGQRQRARVMPRLRAANDLVASRRTFRGVAFAEIALMLVAIGAAASMASGIPAEAEAAARIQSVATTFGDGQVNLTVDPATTGVNTVHLYVFDQAGLPSDETSDVSVTFMTQDADVEADLIVAGPGHWTAPAVPLPEPGTWRVRIAGSVDGRPVDVTGAITVR